MSYYNKYLYFIIFARIFLNPTISSGADYYFSSSMGNDNYSLEQAQLASSPWKTLDKLNELLYSLKPGDRVFFKRGDVFHGTIQPKKGGTFENPIVFDAYGKGDLPIITSLVSLKKPTLIEEGIYQYEALNKDLRQLKIVLLNDQLMPMGRYPNIDQENNGYLTIQTVKDEFSIVGSELPFNVDGGEIVIRKNNWIIDSYTIRSSDATGSIDFVNRGTSPYKPIRGFGYFIQNHVGTLDQLGEWAVSSMSNTLLLYLGERNPSEIKLEIATSDHLLDIGFLINNLSFNNIHFRGSNSNLINVVKASNINIENCLLEFAGENGIYNYGTPDFKVINNKIQNTLNGGIYFWNGTPRAFIEANSIVNTMPFPGMGKNSDLNGIGIYIPGDADNSLILKNKVVNSGYNGIHFGGNNSIVKNNLVENFCLFKQDGAGIYMNSDKMTRSNNKGREIVENIVLKGMGAPLGTDSRYALADGIYLDDNTQGVSVLRNTVAHVNGKGIYLHNASNIELVENMVYDAQIQLKIAHDNLGLPVRDLKVVNNFFTCLGQGEIAYSVSSVRDDIDLMGNSEKNYFLDPYNSEFFFESKDRFDSHSIRRNLLDWSSTYTFDTASTVVNLNQSRFYITKEEGLKQSTFAKDIDIVAGTYHGSSKWVNKGIDDGTLSISASCQEATLCYIPIGLIKAGDQIFIEMDTKSSEENTKVEFFMEKTYDLNQDGLYYLTSGSSRKSVNILLYSSVNEQSESLVIRLPKEELTLFIDNLKVSKVSLRNQPDLVFFQFNFSDKSVTYPLTGKYVNAKSEIFSDSVRIEPYRSSLLFRISEL